MSGGRDLGEIIERALHLISGNGLEIISLGVAVLYMIIRYFLFKASTAVTPARIAISYAAGTSIFPLLLLAISPADIRILEAVNQKGSIIISVAAIFALLSILDFDRK